jgi:hypothetical protein
MPRGKSAIFEDKASRIIWEWSDRKAGKHGHAESPNAWFKREAYRFLRPYVLEGKEKFLESVALKDLRPHKLVQEAIKNPFKLGLLAMCVDESISRGDRHAFGNQMLYAHLHDVPPEFLNGFLAVSGKPAVIAEKLKMGFVEPGFENRAIQFRAAQLRHVILPESNAKRASRPERAK